VSLALTRSPYPIGKIYGADLIGAAMGCIGALVLLNMTRYRTTFARDEPFSV